VRLGVGVGVKVVVAVRVAVEDAVSVGVGAGVAEGWQPARRRTTITCKNVANARGGTTKPRSHKFFKT
jgi:hypothetical protein